MSGCELVHELGHDQDDRDPYLHFWTTHALHKGSVYPCFSHGVYCLICFQIKLIW